MLSTLPSPARSLSRFIPAGSGWFGEPIPAIQRSSWLSQRTLARQRLVIVEIDLRIDFGSVLGTQAADDGSAFWMGRRVDHQGACGVCPLWSGERGASLDGRVYC